MLKVMKQMINYPRASSGPIFANKLFNSLHKSISHLNTIYFQKLGLMVVSFVYVNFTWNGPYPLYIFTLNTNLKLIIVKKIL